MKLLFLSDLHIDNNEKITKTNLKRPLIDYIKKVNPEYLIMAGDLTGSMEHSLEIIDLIEKETGVLVKFIPGNHDIWTEKESSWTEYEKSKHHHSSLIEQPLELANDYVVIGNMGWYDYSFKPEFMNEEEVRMHKGNLWNDAHYAKWGISDQELYQKMHASFKEQLEKYKNKKVIFVNHFIPYIDFIVFKNDIWWNTANSFMGSENLGKLLDTYKNIEYVVFGHTHKRFGLKEFGDKKVICNPFGYAGEWKTKDIKKELEDTGIVIEL